ncbi:DUF4190 domain-containing protein [Nocardioides bizhenqiangii]|uniref:DUF4190 domain-containing protein n=1 Tax=Nocardioides bizhenqiangii TaxID=3095076 RepID=A0ABZ0ZVP5_9ACTN|nr:MULTISPECIES: DUF4190 domain-containing protein [unclassified Nocardioides]MDZ5622916.1 DUF4190 domain-containing protein [Nocardioides sp. HM23]WQQ27899.1 DUF4190 domain-containing protein [Nocardioides sp. HM61]
MSNPYGNDPYGQTPQNPYGAPYQGGAAPTSTDGVSIASLVLGLICCAPVGLILGFVGLKRTKGGQRKGRGFAITGIVLGLLGLLVWIGVGIAAVAGVAWFDSLVLPDEAEVGQCIDIDEEDDNTVLLYEKECSEDHDGEIVAVAEVDDSNREAISNGGQAMTDYCAEIIDPEDQAKLDAVEGLEYNALIEDPNNVDNGDHFVCYVSSSDKLDEPIL